MNDKVEKAVEDQPEPPLSFHADVWKTLSRINLDDHVDYLPKTDKRPAVSYLPWHKAWGLVKRRFPASAYRHGDDLHHPDGTVEVEVIVQISRDGEEFTMSNARLAVMNQWFNAIENPNGRQINDARQRALVKALAFAGLGLHLWGDDNVPVGELEDPISIDQAVHLKELLEASDSDEEAFLKWARVERIEDIPVERYLSAERLLESKIKRRKKS